MVFKILFSDIDGTCVHYQDSCPYSVSPAANPMGDGRIAQARFQGDSRWAQALLLPPSTSGSIGIISRKTIELYAAIRALGIKLVLVSGCRYSTLIQRLPYLPAADAYVCESGGRIFYPDNTLPTAMAIKEDLEWLFSHVEAEPLLASEVPAVRGGRALWQQYDILKKAGVKLDDVNYTTAFRAKISRDEWHQRFHSSLLPGLAVAENLGAVDVYPETSGKLNAALHLIKRFGAVNKISVEETVFMCDDDNDLELAKAVSKAYLPSITSESIRNALNEMPEKFVVATKRSVWATEEILQKLLTEAMITTVSELP